MKSFTVAKRLIKQLIGDKRTIGMMLVAPIFVIYLLSIILTSAPSKANIEIISAPDSFVSALKKEANVSTVSSKEDAQKNLKDKKSNGFVDFSGDVPEITIDGSDPSTSGMVVTTVSKAMSVYSEEKISAVIQDLSKAAKGNIPKINLQNKPEVNYLYGSKDMNLFDTLSPMMMGFFIFFFVFLIAGVSFLRERISGTLDRILATPLKRREIVFGYFLGFGAFIALQTLLIQLFMFYGLNIDIKGNFFTVLLINLILAGGSLSLGTFLSSFARNELQLFQFVPVIIVPQILFSGIFNLAEAPTWVSILSKVFPLTYGAEALKNVALKGYSLSEVSFDVFILFGYAVLFIVLNILTLKKYRKM
ncbi:MAG: ABC transporter permease [Bacillota bacterium]|nr:ABC transporter permease [Bacillota bacterium]